MEVIVEEIEALQRELHETKETLNKTETAAQNDISTEISAVKVSSQEVFHEARHGAKEIKMLLGTLEERSDASTRVLYYLYSRTI
jgi:FtsZ-binding cell division protein ZapB